MANGIPMWSGEYWNPNLRRTREDEREESKAQKDHARAIEIMEKEIAAADKRLDKTQSATDRRMIEANKAELERQKEITKFKVELEKEAIAAEKAKQREGLKAVAGEELSKPKGGFRLPQAAIEPVAGARADYLMKAAEAGPVAAPAAQGMGIQSGIEALDASRKASKAEDQFKTENPALPALLRIGQIIQQSEGGNWRQDPEYQEGIRLRNEKTRLENEAKQQEIDDTNKPLFGSGKAPFQPKATQNRQQDGSGGVAALPTIDRKTGQIIPTGSTFKQEAIEVKPAAAIGRPVAGAPDSFKLILEELAKKYGYR